jgi:hypothetical protein
LSDGREGFDTKIKMREVREQEEVEERRCDDRLVKATRMNSDFGE